MPEVKIKRIKKEDGRMQLAYLEGVLMPNGEFLVNGVSQVLTDENRVFEIDEN